MSTTYYRKYRPAHFTELLGQERINSILTESLKQSRIAHAYLFVGPRGTGKTSTARLLAKSANCTDRKDGEPCDTCASCTTFDHGTHPDYYEIDAASNSGIDHIRELQELLVIPPALGQYRIIVIDEVHGLSKSAFNALLKTLEEPPAHLILILATTEVEKVLPTIVSRCITLEFHPLPHAVVVEKLALICKAEKLPLDTEKLALIADAATGGMRDAESLLTKVASVVTKKTSLDEFALILGVTPHSYLHTLAAAVQAGDAVSVSAHIHQATATGFAPLSIATGLIGYFESALGKSGADTARVFACLSALVDLPQTLKAAPLPMILLQVSLLRLCYPPTEASGGVTKTLTAPKTPAPSTPKATPSTTTKATTEIPRTATPKVLKQPAAMPESPTTPAESVQANTQTNTETLPLTSPLPLWPKLLDAVKAENFSLYQIIQSAKPAWDGTMLSLVIANSFHRGQMTKDNYRLTLEACFAKIYKYPVPYKSVAGAAPSTSLGDAARILGV